MATRASRSWTSIRLMRAVSNDASHDFTGAKGVNDVSIESSGGSASNTYLLVPILLLFLLLIIAVLRSPNLVSPAGIGSAVIVMAPLALATYALMALAIA